MVNSGLPEKLLQSLNKVKGFDEKSFIQVHGSGEQITSIRFNPRKSLIPDSPLLIGKVPWSSYGYYLAQRPSFTLDPLLHAGAYYVQEASSMFVEEVLRQTVDLKKPLRILDLCAAPGGKSTLIQSLISKDSLLVTNEVIKSRVGILTENMTKWGAENVVVTNNDPHDFCRLPYYFDAIIVDAPCSGSGLFRRDHDAINEWSEENVILCNQRQQRILADVMPSLKQNGVLIYSTCSYSKEEDEDILDWITKQFEVDSLPLRVDENWNIIETFSDLSNGYGYRFYPYKLKGEGFFIAAFRKKGGIDSYILKTTKTYFERLNRKEEAIARKWITDNDENTFFKKDDRVFTIRSNSMNDLNLLQSSLYIKKAGILIGKIIKDELVPEHELALSTIINEGVNSIELSKEDALKYLRKEEISIDTNSKGWCIVKYQDQNLGWVKILQNRINNYYPSEWRIRKT